MEKSRLRCRQTIHFVPLLGVDKVSHCGNDKLRKLSLSVIVLGRQAKNMIDRPAWRRFESATKSRTTRSALGPSQMTLTSSLSDGICLIKKLM